VQYFAPKKNLLLAHFFFELNLNATVEIAFRARVCLFCAVMFMSV
jgi:hypothetical protein